MSSVNHLFSVIIGRFLHFKIVIKLLGVSFRDGTYCQLNNVWWYQCVLSEHISYIHDLLR